MERRKISLAHVKLNEQAKRHAQDCLDSGMLARGKYIQQFEETVAEFTGAEWGVATCNGTMANVLLLRAMRDIYGYQRVAIPALTFAAQLAAVYIAGMRVKCVDVDGYFQMSAYDGKDGSLAFPAALLGKRMDRGHGRIIVDSCETFARDIAIGIIACTVSFYATHAVGIGEGGMVLTNDIDIAEYCWSLRDHGQEIGGPLAKFRHRHLGYNAKMSNLHAAIGCGLMEDASKIIARRCEVAHWYDKAIHSDGSSPSDWLASPHGYPIDCQSREKRDMALMSLFSQGIEARRLFSVLPREEAFRWLDLHDDYPNATRFAERWLYVPCHQGMSEEDVDYVCKVFTEV